MNDQKEERGDGRGDCAVLVGGRQIEEGLLTAQCLADTHPLSAHCSETYASVDIKNLYFGRQGFLQYAKGKSGLNSVRSTQGRHSRTTSSIASRRQ